MDIYCRRSTIERSCVEHDFRPDVHVALARYDFPRRMLDSFVHLLLINPAHGQHIAWHSPTHSSLLRIAIERRDNARAGKAAIIPGGVDAKRLRLSRASAVAIPSEEPRDSQGNRRVVKTACSENAINAAAQI